MSETAKHVYDVILSHAAADTSTLLPLALRLEEEGLDVWFESWVDTSGSSPSERLLSGLW
jgi:hypothetical protein